MHKVLVLNGPNINMLGNRELSMYGETNYTELEKQIKKEADKLSLEVDLFQSNHEGDIIDTIHKSNRKYNCIIINAGAYSHYSIGIRDALAAVNIPTIDVHITNIYAREEFRHKSVIAPVCVGQISGLGIYSYILALHAVKNIVI